MFAGVIAVPASAATPTWIFRTDKLVPLVDSSTEIVNGAPSSDGCIYASDQEAIERPVNALPYVIRDLAIDPVGCRIMRERGTLAEFAQLPGTDESIHRSLPMAATPAERSSGATTSSSSGSRTVHQRLYWTDLAGLVVNYDQTDTTWSWASGCTTSGSSAGDWGWAAWRGWWLVSNGATQNRICSRMFSETTSHMRNWDFCDRNVDTWYYYVRNFGYSDGSVGYYFNTDTYNECWMLFRNWSGWG